jgi:hypothetical protein
MNAEGEAVFMVDRAPDAGAAKRMTAANIL